MRLVIAHDLDKKIPQQDAWKAPNGKYYSSEDAWKKLYEENTWRNKSIELLCSMLNYQPPIPTYVFKCLKDFNDVGFKILYYTIIDQKKSIQWALETKSFDNEIQKIKYIFAILLNNYNDTSKNLKKMESQKESIDNLPEDIEVNNPIQKTHNIARFIDD